MPISTLSKQQYLQQHRVFHTVLLMGIFFIMAVWYVEDLSGMAGRRQHIGYLVSIIIIALVYVISRYWRRTLVAKTLIFVYSALFLVYLVVFGFLEAARVGTLYPIASSLQWVPIIYVLAFLFLHKRFAIIGAMAVYTALVSLLLLTYTGLFPVDNAELRLLMVNMSFAHGLYIVSMFAVVRLKHTTKVQTDKAIEMERAANQDSMLAIPNRRFMQTLMDSYVRESKPVALLLIDVDHFKVINDTHGHPVGDDVLVQVVAHLKLALRASDTIGRWGGEEFLVLSDISLGENASLLADRLRQKVATALFRHQETVTISVGISEYIGSGQIESVLHDADQALYEAKRQGRNQVVSAPTNTKK